MGQAQGGQPLYVLSLFIVLSHGNLLTEAFFSDGFDVVAEATGVESLVNDAINYVTRGGTLLVYGVYEDKARLPGWSPTDIFVNEKRIIGSFSQTYCFPRAIDLLDSGKIKTTGMVTDVFPLSDYQGALDKMASRKALKIAIKPEHKD